MSVFCSVRLPPWPGLRGQLLDISVKIESAL